MKTRADVVKLMAHNLNSYGKPWTPKETAKAVKHGWDDGGITLRETFEVDGGSDYGGDSDDGDDDASEDKEGEPDDFMSPLAPRERGTEDEDGEEGEDEIEVADKEALETYARFKAEGYEKTSIPFPYEGETEGSAKNRLRTFVRTLHEKGIILKRFKVSNTKSFEFSRNRLIMVRFGGRIRAAAPDAAAPGGARALTPEVGGSPAEVHSLMN
jgi:hypothetical protein